MERHILCFEPSENRLENVSISHAGRTASGQSGEKGAVQLTGGDESGAAIVNCSIADNDGYGIIVTDEADLDDFRATSSPTMKAPDWPIF